MAQKISGKVVVREKLGNSITKFSKFLNRKTNKQNLQNVNNPESKDKQLKTKKKSPSTKNPQQGWEEYLGQYNTCLIHLKAWVPVSATKANTGTPNTREMKAGGTEVQGHILLHRMFKSSWNT